VLTAVSEAVQSEVERAAGRPVLRTPNGIRLDDWRVARREGDGIRLAAVMRLAPKKAPCDLADALRAAVDARPDRRVTLTVAGDGPERAALRRRAARLGVADRLVLLGTCGRPAVRDLLSGASVFLQPGRCEAFGIAILEARAAGVPIVAMAGGGVPELVEERTHGLLARSRDAFAAATAALVADDRLRAACAHRAAVGLERFDWTEVARRHEAAYAAALASRQTMGRQEKKSAATAT